MTEQQTPIGAPHVMIDFETLGQGSNPYLMSFGAFIFWPDANDIDIATATKPEIFQERKWHTVFSAKDQKARGRTIDPSTLLWWLRSSGGGGGEELLALLSKGWDTEALSLQDFYRRFCWWLIQSGFDYNKSIVWARGTNFDLPLLEGIATTLQQENHISTGPFWRFDRIEDVRTILRQTNTIKSDNPHKHDALQDCIHQAYDVQQARNKLNSTLFAKVFQFPVQTEE